MSFSGTKKKVGRPMMVKRKLDGAVDESSTDQEIRKSDAIVQGLHLAEQGLTAGWLAIRPSSRQNLGET